MEIHNWLNDWLVIINPNAGKGRGRKDWKKISYFMNVQGFQFSFKSTEKKGDAVLFARDAVISGCRKIIVIGGDGTLNEVVNGIFTQDICKSDEVILGMIPVGTGNDWGKMFGIHSDYEEAIKIIRQGKLMLHDTGSIIFQNGLAKEKRYFINIAGLGFDARVVRKTNLQKDKGKGGKLIYLFNLLTCLLSYKSTDAEIAINGHKITGSIFTISIGNGVYSGGGMKQTPGAIPDDGLLNITIIRHMSTIEIIKSLKMLYDGTILSHPKIEGYACREIQINSIPEMYAEVDGESVGHTPVEVGILPRSIKVIYNIRVIG
jgi:YegS/Rv2252/BmrU family lipid kinase